MIRWGIFSIDAVIPERGDYIKYFPTDFGITLRVKMGSLRYKTFAESLTCCVCGINGEYFALEGQDNKTAHFNLYGVDKHGREVLMTKDHIVPVSKGGKKKQLQNLRTMCYVCNQIRSNREEMSPEDILAQRYSSKFCFQQKRYRFPTKEDVEA